MSKFTTIERQYIKGIVQNLSLQRFTDADIVNYLHKAKAIEITKAKVNKIRNRQEQDAAGWYVELKESRHKLIAFYKDRLDSLLSYQQKLNLILLNTNEKSDTSIRAIAELHRIEMSIFTLLKEFPEFNIKPLSTANTIECHCSSANGDIINHSKCRYCKQVWCPATLKQDWCPNADCSHGIKGNNFQPWDEHNKWIKCPSCQLWFKNSDILAVHNCYMKAVPEIEGDPFPGIGGDGATAGPTSIIEEPSPLPTTTTNESDPVTVIITPYSSSIQEQEPDIQEPDGEGEEVEQEPEESEADRYWRYSSGQG